MSGQDFGKVWARLHQSLGKTCAKLGQDLCKAWARLRESVGKTSPKRGQVKPETGTSRLRVPKWRVKNQRLSPVGPQNGGSKTSCCPRLVPRNRGDRGGGGLFVLKEDCAYLVSPLAVIAAYRQFIDWRTVRLADGKIHIELAGSGERRRAEASKAELCRVRF